MERSLAGDAAFARVLHDQGMISDAWYAAYLDARDFFRALALDADVLAFLNVSVDECLRRVRQRDRNEEGGLTAEYQEALRVATRAEHQAEARGGRALLLELDDLAYYQSTTAVHALVQRLEALRA